MKKIKNLFSAINTKITVLFLLLFIPLFLAGFSIYKYGYTSVKQEITDSSTSQLSLYAHSLSDEITRIQLSCYQLASNEDINYLANAYSIMGEYERSQYILRTAQLLSILQNSSSFIETTALINIHRRLRMKYGPFAGITLTQEGVCGLTVSIHIPIN